jgi:hypothetical protein
MAAINNQLQLSVYSFLHAQFRKWAKRLNLCLNLRPQLGHAWRGSWPHSTRTWRRNEWYSRYTLLHLGHAKKPSSCVTASTVSSGWFWCFLVELGNRTVMLLPDVYTISAERVKNTVNKSVDRVVSQAISKSSHDLICSFFISLDVHICAEYLFKICI